MAELTPNLSMDYLLESQASGEVTHNNALNVLDALVQCHIKTRDINTPPGGESDGEGWLIGDAGTGTWAGHDNELTFYYAGYLFWTPWEGLTVWVDDEKQHIYYDGTQWVDLGSEWHNIFCCITATPAMEDPSGAAIPIWPGAGLVSVGDYCHPTVQGHYVFECVVGGNEGAVEPTWPIVLGQDLASGPNTLVWRARGLNVITMTVDETEFINPYEALRYTVDGNLRHGIVKSITATRIFLIGAPLWADTDLTTLDHGQDPAKVVQLSFHLPGNYNVGGDTDLLLEVAYGILRTWTRPAASLVYMSIFNFTADTGEEPHVNVSIGGIANFVVAEGTAKQGVLITATSKKTPHEVAIFGEDDTTNKVDFNEDIEFALDHVGAANNNDAEDFNAELTFVLH